MKHSRLFWCALVAGVLLLAFGVFLLVFMRYHERAYIFLCTGAACLIGGIAGLLTIQRKVKTAIFYGITAFSIISITVGINYLTYRIITDQERGYVVLAVAGLFLIVGVVGAIVTQPQARLAAFFSALTLGVIASSGIAALLIGSHLLTVHRYHKDAYVIIAAGIICFLGGIAVTALAQRKMARVAIQSIQSVQHS